MGVLPGGGGELGEKQRHGLRLGFSPAPLTVAAGEEYAVPHTALAPLSPQDNLVGVHFDWVHAYDDILFATKGRFIADLWYLQQGNLLPRRIPHRAGDMGLSPCGRETNNAWSFERTTPFRVRSFLRDLHPQSALCEVRNLEISRVANLRRGGLTACGSSTLPATLPVLAHP